MTDEELLSRRKKDAMSSYISETEFSNTFLANDIIYTVGWWISKDGRGRLYFFIHKTNISDFDFELVQIFGSITTNIFQVITNEQLTIIRNLNTFQEWSLIDFVTNYSLTARRQMTFNHNDTEVKMRYLEYFRQRGILDQVKESVSIEDEFFYKYFISINIDFILKNMLGILFLEVKYKYKDRSGNFGMNKMQYECLSILQSRGYYVFNIILDNSDRVDIIDRINRNQCTWIYDRLEQGLTEIRTAPSRTGYFNSRPQQYYVLNGNSYKELNEAANFINMICPLCGGELVLRTGPYGAFLGCENYRSINCRGIIKI